MFVLTFSPLGEKVNTNMALIHRQVKKSTLGKIVNNHLVNLQFAGNAFVATARLRTEINFNSKFIFPELLRHVNYDKY